MFKYTDMLKILVSALAGALMFGSAAVAGSHGFSADDVADYEILPGWRTETGTYMTALRIKLAPGWKTYWRAPGQAGIPPRFDWDGSKNLAAAQLFWPAPKVYIQNGLRTIGYKDELILPIEMTPKQRGQDVILRARIELGICQDICIPVNVRVAADLKGAGAADPRIRAALEAGPETAREAGLRDISCALEPISDGMRLTATINLPRLGDDELAIFELPDQTIWIAEAEASRQGPTLTAVTEMVPPSNGPFKLDRGDVRITVLGAGRAVDIGNCTG